jgi:hypothetical protein
MFITTSPFQKSITASLFKKACSKKNGDYEKRQENEEQHFCNGSRALCNSAEAKNGRDDCNDEKYDRPA